MKIQSNMYINNPDMTSRNIEKKENSSHALVQEDDIQISDSARKLVETARNKVSDFHTMHFSSINGEIREIPAEYKCENLFKLDLKATSISGEQSAFEGCSENQSEVFGKWLDENASEYLTEDEMKKIIKEDLKIERFELPREEAIKLMEEREEPYKVELIKELPEGEVISFYKQGEFVDLCRGPHLPSTGKVKAIKLTSKSAAYWRGDSKNKSLQRVYGISFPKASELEDYLKKLEEAKQRDHRKLGKELNIFMTHDLVGKGLPMYLPNGYVVWELLENYIKRKERKLDYKHVLTPPLASVELYKTSGHWDHYKDNMFPKMEVEGEEFVLRPMNCPHHMMIYANTIHSYRDLPIRIGEIARDCRFESSGTLKGIERVRTFCQNDAHLFVTPEQIESEFKSVVDLILEVYKELNITDYHFELSLRDPNDKVKYHPDDQMWDSAENTLRQVLDDIGIDYVEKVGEAAFYGPKLDFHIKDSLGRVWQCGTIQLDMNLPERFDLTYIDSDGSKKRPVMLHRVIYGSIERFIGILIEHYAGVFPLWLSPVQVNVLPVVSSYHGDYAKEIYDYLIENDIRCEIDSRDEKLGYRLREAQIKKIPYTLILGEEECNNKTISYRKHGSKDTFTTTKEEFLNLLKEEIKNKSN